MSKSRTIHLSAVTSRDRIAVVEMVSAAIGELGCVLDHRQYSNFALMIAFELRLSNLQILAPRLLSAGLRFDADSTDILARLGTESATELNELSNVFLHVTFFHDEPDVKIPVPAVPG